MHYANLFVNLKILADNGSFFLNTGAKSDDTSVHSLVRLSTVLRLDLSGMNLAAISIIQPVLGANKCADGEQS